MKNKLLQIRIDQELVNEMNNTIETLKERGYQPNVTTSEFIRQSVQRWIEFYNQIEEGKTLAMLKTEEFNLKDLTELNDILLEVAEKTENEKIKKFLVALEDRLVYEIPRLQHKESKRKEKLLNDIDGDYIVDLTKNQEI